MRWEKMLEMSLNGFTLIKSEVLVAMQISVFVKDEYFRLVGSVESYSCATGLMGHFGNKGGVGISFMFGGLKILMVNSHFCAHAGRKTQRNAAYFKICKELMRGNRNFTELFDSVFWFGDLNYRVDGERREVIGLLNEGKLNVFARFNNF